MSVRGNTIGRVINNDLGSTKGTTMRGCVSERSTSCCTAECGGSKLAKKRVVLLGPPTSRCCSTAGTRTLGTLRTCPNKVRVNKKVATRGTTRCLRRKTDRIVIASCMFRGKRIQCSQLSQLGGTMKGRRLMLSLDYQEHRGDCCVMAGE